MNTDPLLQVFFEEAAEKLAEYEQALVLLEQTPQDADLLNHIFRCAHTIKSNSAMLGFQAIARFTHALEDLLDRFRNGSLRVSSAAVDTLLRSEAVLRMLLRRARDGAELSGAEEQDADTVLGGVRELVAGKSEIVVPLSPAETVCAAAAEVVFPRTAPEGNGATVPATHGKPEHRSVGTESEPARPRVEWEEATSIRVPIDRIDRLVNLVGELVITQSIMSQSVASFAPHKLPQLKEVVIQMDRHARELHERVMSIRMVPLRHLFGRLPRMVRDLAAAVGKLVDIDINGEDTELDRTVIERISDPLTHLVRNAVDHGIETPEERREVGKPNAGRLKLSAYQQGGSIFVEVADDGRGLDLPRVQARALAMGLVAPEQLLDEERATFLIFQPGLSTADRVTELSGRGVGLDVVKRNIESLGGSIAIESRPGQGTCFRIQLPLTVAIMDGQAVRVGDQVYLLPLVSIVESVRPPKGAVHSVGDNTEVVLVRGNPLLLLRLHRLFDVDGAVTDPALGLLVVVEHERRQAAILVDEILDQQQVVIKSLEAHFEKVLGVAGGTILGDGGVSLILDVPELMTLARSDASRGRLRRLASTAPRVEVLGDVIRQ